MRGKTLYVLAASLTKSEPGRTAINVMNGYRVSTSEAEAKGSFLTSVLKEMPGYSIAALVCMAVPPEAIELVVQEPTHDQ